MWWTAPEGRLGTAVVPASAYSAEGNGGHLILIVPPASLVVVMRGNTWLPSWMPGARVNPKAASEFLRLLMEARRC